MKKMYAKFRNAVVASPIKSLFFTVVLTVLATSAVILSTGLKSIFVPNGPYVVHGTKMIRIDGDGELPLYENVVSTHSDNIPTNRTLIIHSGYSHFIPGTRILDLVYHRGVLAGDVYEVSVALAETFPSGGYYYSKENFRSESCYKPADQLRLDDRIMMAVFAATESVSNE